MNAFVNDPTWHPEARQPRGLVKVSGAVVPGWIEFDVDNNVFFHADTFRCSFALSALPAEYGPAWWASQSTIYVELFAGFPSDPENFTAADLDSFIYGRVDEVTYDPAGTTIEVTGRDLTAAFIDAKTYEQFVNQTASQIAATLAQRHGLTPVVTTTSTKAGTYYEIENRRIPLDRTEWDLLTWLAHEEGFVVYVKGKELHFEPQADPDSAKYALRWVPPALDGSQLTPEFNGKRLVCSRNLTLANDIVVYVRSWNTKQKKGFTVKAQATHAKTATGRGRQQPAGAAQVYSYVRPGLTKEQAQKVANAKLVELSAHEMKISAELPGDNLLAMGMLIDLSGTGTAFDQAYYPDSIVRAMSVRDGYTMRVTAKNHPPESTVLA
jgi:phage protein D